MSTTTSDNTRLVKSINTNHKQASNIFILCMYVAITMPNTDDEKGGG